MNAKIFFFCTMINKWNLSRETTQMACPISFQNRKPCHDSWQASHSSFGQNRQTCSAVFFLSLVHEQGTFRL